MQNAGTMQIFVVLLLLVAPLVLALVLKRVYPDRTWVGILLALLGVFGQFYQADALMYFIALLLIFVIWTGYFGPSVFVVCAINVLSALVMWYRFRKNRETTRA